jgi:hypothetical protein
MPRGGYRPGAGRKPRAQRPDETKQAPPDIRVAAARARMSPLDYMLAVLNDPSADDARRDRMAQAAAPYVHPKAADAAPGKKEQREQAARTAERGTDWESLLQ